MNETICPRYQTCMQFNESRSDCHINLTEQEAHQCRYFTPFPSHSDIEKIKLIRKGRENFSQ